MSEGNHKRLADIKQKPGNDNKCADCGAPGKMSKARIISTMLRIRGS